jgi:Cu/Ag efflux pump CusA
MTDVTLFHNPDCGTSRNTLALIRNAGIEPQVIEYLREPPTRDQLRAMIRAAGPFRTAGAAREGHAVPRRRRLVTADVEDRDVASFMREVKQKIAAQVSLPAGVSISYGGAAEAQRQAQRELLLQSLVAAVIIVVLLSLVFAHTRNLWLVLANTPFALAGGVLAVLLTGASLSIGSLVGFISLFGVSMRNSILMVSHYEELVLHEGQPLNLQTAIRGANERLLPILMTALVVALGLLPIALNSEQAGKEIEGPMAIVILGGLATLTALNLLVLPTLALRYGCFGKPQRPIAAEKMQG